MYVCMYAEQFFVFVCICMYVWKKQLHVCMCACVHVCRAEGQASKRDAEIAQSFGMYVLESAVYVCVYVCMHVCMHRYM